MDLTAVQFEDLVGAYVLDACEPDEVAAVERYAATDADAAAAIERLREVAVGLGAAGASQPPVALRDRLVRSAADRVRPLSARAALEDETERFNTLLDTIAAHELDEITENGLSVHELVQHVEAIDRAFVAAAADPSVEFIGAFEVAGITAAELPGRAGETFAESVTRFRETRAELAGLADRAPAGHRVAGYERDDVLVIRVFETWTHHDDIRRALGRDNALPVPAVMRTMSELAMKSTPYALAVRDTAHPGRTARIVLTGIGGGEFDVPCAPDEDPAPEADVVVRAAAVDWCRRFADRITPADIRYEVEGDPDIARDLVESANAFAGL